MPSITRPLEEAEYAVIWKRAMDLLGLAGQPIYERGSSYQLTELETVVSNRDLKKILDAWSRRDITLKLEITKDIED